MKEVLYLSKRETKDHSIFQRFVQRSIDRYSYDIGGQHRGTGSSKTEIILRKVLLYCIYFGNQWLLVEINVVSNICKTTQTEGFCICYFSGIITCSLDLCLPRWSADGILINEG